MTYYEKKLNEIQSDEYQKKAYDSMENTVVLAGPGSGKTSVLTLKLINLLDGYIKKPRGLACITYSRETVREFKGRLEKYGFEESKNVFIGTVHAFCLSNIIEPFCDCYDFGIPKKIKIATKKEIKSSFDEAITKSEITSNINLVDMNRQRSLGVKGVSTVTIASNDEAKKVANEYEKIMRQKGLIDFDTIIIASVSMIQKNEYIRKCLESKYEWILIDEYQDLGHPLHEIILTLNKYTNIKFFAVGDPDQSIYGFAGSKPEYLKELANLPEFKVIHLVNNYRSNQDIIDASELVLDKIRDYYAKTRNGEHAKFQFVKCNRGLNDQYDYVADVLINQYLEEGIPKEEIAILVPTNKNCRELGEKLSQKNIPYYIPKHQFDMSDIVRWLELCSRYVANEKGTFNEIFNFWSMLEPNNDVLINDESIIIEKKRLMNILDDSLKFKDSLLEWINYLIDNLNLIEIVKKCSKYPDEEDNIKSLINEINTKTYEKYTVAMFENISKPTNQVTITTRHSSKGLEFESVVMLGMEEGHFPQKNKQKLCEDNRLCFVCVSRAKKNCCLIYSCEFLEPKYKIVRKYEPSTYYTKLKENYDDNGKK